MIGIRQMIAAAALAVLATSTPALAYDDDNRGNRYGHHMEDHRGEWRDNRDEWRAHARRDRRADRRDDWRDERRAYAKGYRDAARAHSYHGGYSRAPYNGRYSRAPYDSGYSRAPYDGGFYGNATYGRPPAYQAGNYWYGNNGRIQCRRNDGTTGALVGAVAGGTLGNILAQSGDRRVGSIIGGTLGAILGRELDRGNGYCR